MVCADAENEQKQMGGCHASCVKLCMLRERYGEKERLVAVYRANYVVQLYILCSNMLCCAESKKRRMVAMPVV